MEEDNNFIIQSNLELGNIKTFIIYKTKIRKRFEKGSYS